MQGSRGGGADPPGGGYGALGMIGKGRSSPALPVGCRASGLSLIYRTLCCSCVSPGGTGGQKVAQPPELASAEMSLHAIYLHQVSRKVWKKEKSGGKAAAQKRG